MMQKKILVLDADLGPLVAAAIRSIEAAMPRQTKERLDALCLGLESPESDDKALSLLKEVVTATPQFEMQDCDVGGADMLEWYGEFRRRVKEGLGEFGCCPEAYILRSPKGFWSAEDGWVDLPQYATVYWGTGGGLPELPNEVKADSASFLPVNDVVDEGADDDEEGASDHPGK